MSGVLRLAMPRGRTWTGAVWAGIGSGVAAVALLASSGYLITRAGEHPPILYLTLVIVGVRAFALGRAAFRYLDRLQSHDAAFRQLALVRTAMYERLSAVAPAGLGLGRHPGTDHASRTGGTGRTGRGDLLERLVSDTDRLQDLPLRVVGPLVTSAVVSVASVVAVWIVLPAAGAVLLAALVVSGIVGVLLTTAVARRTEHETAAERGAISDLILDTVRTLDVFVAYGTLAERLDRIQARDRALIRRIRRRSSSESLVGALGGLIGGAAVIGIIAVGAPAVVAGAISGPYWALAVFVPLALFEIVAGVPVAVLAYRGVRAAGARVEQVVPAVPPTGVVVEPPIGAGDSGPEPVEPLPVPPAATLRLRDLSVRWPGAASRVVDRVSFTLEPGTVAVLEGPSGAGKSSIADALVRFVDYEGSYTLDGVEARTMHPDEVRSRVGLIEQDPFVFDESARQNLLFAKDTADDDELTEVLDRVGLGSWLVARGGLDEPVGERGGLLSGGQAHRLALARALLHAFPVLVLDEPTADIDPDVADRLLRDLVTTARAAGRSVLLISHVPVDPALVDRRLRLEAGRLVTVDRYP